MNQLTFRVSEADLNSRRSDHSIIEVHKIAVGDAIGTFDQISQNLVIDVDPIKISKHGSYADIGPVGYGHYYIILADFDIKLYSVNPRQLVNISTFGGGFIYIDRYRDQYDRRRIIIRSDLKNIQHIDNNISSVWLNNIGSNGIIEFKLFAIDNNSTDDVHTFINAYSFNGGLHGSVDVYYNDLNDQMLTGDNYYLNLWVDQQFYSNGNTMVTSDNITNAITLAKTNSLGLTDDPRFFVPPPGDPDSSI